MHVCYLCKVRLRKNEGTLHILPSLPVGSGKRLICDSCHVRFHEKFNKPLNSYSKKYLKKIRSLYFNTQRLEKMRREDKSYNEYLKEFF